MEMLKTYVAKAARAAKLTGMEIQCGKTRVFMKSEAFFELEKANDQAGMTHRLLIQSHGRATLAEITVRRKKWEAAAHTIQAEYRDYLIRSAEIREKRRIMREQLLAQHRKEQDAFTRAAMSEMRDIERQEMEAFSVLSKFLWDYLKWIKEKKYRDVAERGKLFSAESQIRAEIHNEFQKLLVEKAIDKARLHFAALPEIALYMREALRTDEVREFNILRELFKEDGATMFRVEVERQERRYRRIMARAEDIQWCEILQRLHLYRDFEDSVTREVRRQLPVLLTIKEYARSVALRTQRRQERRLSHQQVELFSQRHPRDTTLLMKELVRLQVGATVNRYTEYRREGEKKSFVRNFASTEPWRGVSGVPDIDQVLWSAAVHGKHPSVASIKQTPTKSLGSDAVSPSRTPKAKKESSAYDLLSYRTRAEEREGDSMFHLEGSFSGEASSPALRVPIHESNVFETFRDKNDEMGFLRMRHLLAKEFRELAALDRYNGPLVQETSITDKKTFNAAQDLLQTLTLRFAQSLVHVIRRMNAFCLKKNIPEQDHVTGLWQPYNPVPREMVQKFPLYTDWKRLLEEQRRLHYAVENYRNELMNVFQQCVQRGARVPGVTLHEKSTVSDAHEAYLALKGHFEVCGRCLFPMAPKQTLVYSRLLWPKVKDVAFPDRCHECMAGIQLRNEQGLAEVTGRGSPRSFGKRPSLNF